MAAQRVNLWLLLASSGVVLASLIAQSSSAAPPAIESGGVFSRLRRVQKSTYATPQDSATSDLRLPKAHTLKSRTSSSLLSMMATTAAGTVGKGPKTPDSAASLRQRLDETVQKVRSRSKEFHMEQEQKRVDRKLRRDQKKVEREQPSLAASINPHNLQMPDCPTGKVYNGRRCVLSSKTPKH